MLTQAKYKAKKGNYYKRKTKEWFTNKGYYSVYLEQYQTIFTKKGLFYKKNDLLGSDGLSMKIDEIIFWNSKFAGDDRSRDTAVSSAKREFAQYPFPLFVKRQIIIWRTRVKQPEIINI